MKKKSQSTSELAALHSLGALDGQDARAFARLLAESHAAQADAIRFEQVAEALARSLPTPLPSPDLKGRILRQVEQQSARARAEAAIKSLLPPSKDGLSFSKDAPATGWTALPVAGAFVKLLSFDDASGYAVVLGKLEAGSRYPAHRHHRAEEIYMLSGDLHIGEEVIRAGDFHHADAGSAHPVNWSQDGCTLLCVISKDDLLAQLARV